MGGGGEGPLSWHADRDEAMHAVWTAALGWAGRLDSADRSARRSSCDRRKSSVAVTPSQQSEVRVDVWLQRPPDPDCREPRPCCASCGSSDPIEQHNGPHCQQWLVASFSYEAPANGSVCANCRESSQRQQDQAPQPALAQPQRDAATSQPPAETQPMHEPLSSPVDLEDDWHMVVAPPPHETCSDHISGWSVVEGYLR